MENYVKQLINESLEKVNKEIEETYKKIEDLESRRDGLGLKLVEIVEKEKLIGKALEKAKSEQIKNLELINELTKNELAYLNSLYLELEGERFSHIKNIHELDKKLLKLKDEEETLLEHEERLLYIVKEKE